MNDIIFEKEAFLALKNYLIKQYNKKNVVLFCTEKTFNFYKKKLYIFKNLPLTLTLEFLDNDLICNSIFLDVIKNKIKECDLIICFENMFIDLIKIACTKTQKKYVLVPNYCSNGLFYTPYATYQKDDIIEKVKTDLPECVFVDYSIVSFTKSNHIANLYAYALSLNSNILHLIYQNNKEDVIENLNKDLRGIYIFNEENLKSEMGKIKLFQFVLELQIKLNSYGLEDINMCLCPLFQKYYHNQKLNDGEVFYILSLLILSFHNNIINNELCAPPLNIEKRIKRLKMLFGKEEKMVQQFTDTVFMDKNKELYLFAKKKTFSQKYIHLAFNRILSNMSILKKIYLDKGVVFHKINLQDFYHCISLACDIFDEKILNILRDVGFIDLIA